MMKFHAALALVLTVFTGSTMSSGTVQGQASEMISDLEAYAVYASVVPLTFSTGDKPLTALTLLQETRAGMDCLGPEKNPKLQPEWRRVVESYRKENARGRIIRSGFNLGVPYSTATVAQLRQLMRDAGYSQKSPQSNGLGADVFARFPGGRLVALSAVGFNAERTRAMVAMQFDCLPSWEPGTKSAPECHQGRHFALEKKGGHWNIVQNVHLGCFWTA